MTSTEYVASDVAVRHRLVDVDIIVPVHNEQDDLEWSIRRLHAYLSDRFPLSWAITIADNASTDDTWAIASHLAEALAGVRAVRLDQKGRGRALRAAWTASEATVVAYMDVDLSTDLDALLPLVAPLVTGHSDVAIGSRLAPAARVVRGAKREVISRIYNLVLRATLHNGFSDAQCGFKAVRADVARRLLPLIEDEAWFFDTELLLIAEHNGMRIHEVPVDWVDDPDSRVDIVPTATADLKGVARMLRRRALGAVDLPIAEGRDRPASVAGQVVRFAGVGILTTLLFATLFAALVGPAGPMAADVVALTIAALVNTALNRRVTFGVRGAAHRRRHLIAGAAIALLPLALTLGSLALVGWTAGLLAQLAAVTVANLTATAARFALLRRVFAPPSGGGR